MHGQRGCNRRKTRKTKRGSVTVPYAAPAGVVRDGEGGVGNPLAEDHPTHAFPVTSVWVLEHLGHSFCRSKETHTSPAWAKTGTAIGCSSAFISYGHVTFALCVPGTTANAVATQTQQHSVSGTLQVT